ncbi:MAG: PEP-CTERM sorting domain-containing protein [Phycisphaerae bacterium]|nr:PEP-CTERM sorting domain-containing protein [Phycisphaerae bacterium]
MRLRNKFYCVCIAFAVISMSDGRIALADDLELLNTLSLNSDDVYGIGGLAPGSGALYTGDILPSEIWDNVAGYHRFSPADGSVAETGWIIGTNNQTFSPAGMASNGGYLCQAVFSSDPEKTGIVKYVPGNPAIVSSIYQLQGTEAKKRTKGLTHDGSFIWQAHYSPDVGRLYAIDPATGDRVNTLFVDPYPYGLAYDGRYFWVAHHNPVSHTSYVAKYDRSENQLATYALPASMSPNAALGDLAVTGSGLYAHVLGTNDVAHFALPASEGTPPAMGSGVTAVSVETHAGIYYDGKDATDFQTAANYGQLPIAASVERQSSGSAMDVAGLARAYYDESGVHHVVSSLAYGRDYSSDLEAAGALVINKSILITPASCGHVAGTAVNATGSLTFDGLLQALRDENEGWPDATGLVSRLIAKVTKTGPGGEVVCFDGTISLLGQNSENWVRTVLTGSADTAALREACNDIVITDGLASLDLDDVEVGFSIPAIVGQTFYVKILLHTKTYIPAWAEGLGAEVAFGIESDMGEGYFVGGDPEAYDDDYSGNAWLGWPGVWFDVPEPSSMIMLLTGGLIALRRRRERGRRSF